MFKRFTEGARLAVVLAQEEAREFRHNYIGSFHLLIGVARVEPPLLPVAPEVLRERVIALEPVGTNVHQGQIPFTAEAKGALEGALREALAHDHQQIGPGHILLALLAVDHRIAELIVDVGLQTASATQRAEVSARASQPAGDPEDLLRAGHPVAVTLAHNALPMGDLGHPRTDARLLLLMLTADTRIGRWLRGRGIDEAAIRAEVPDLDEPGA